MKNSRRFSGFSLRPLNRCMSLNPSCRTLNTVPTYSPIQTRRSVIFLVVSYILLSCASRIVRHAVFSIISPHCRPVHQPVADLDPS